MTLQSALTGISGILVTPFDAEDRIAPARLGPILDRALAAGLHVPVVNGNTGEFYSLTVDEAEAICAELCAMIDGRAPVLAGVGRSVKDACRLAAAAARAGAAGLMVHQPPDPFAAPRGVVDYVRRVADAGGGLPLMLYLRNDAIGTAAIAALCAVPGIIWVGGLAEVWAPALYAVGARGFTSGLVNIWPERSLAIHAALESGDYAAARALIAGMAAFEEIRAQELNGTNVTGVKAALQAMGQDCGPTRPPAAWPLTEIQQRRMTDFLRRAGLPQN
ncbi:dihydrodipicolinate synthase family protein [Paracoccus sp. TOH]|uniref:dihydrodipicolinate synthase family protein n=1 Tax=Paracoccus sp. TOH TaxID=1263728 RepID=UPI0025AED52C|nr:dihydrodipicolinate synthase family protein [Paracoccus sp. TOH]WJS86983.1 dihydrodipicolinate synthase family protein [Paracoccus sp. TOH]